MHCSDLPRGAECRHLVVHLIVFVVLAFLLVGPVVGQEAPAEEAETHQATAEAADRELVRAARERDREAFQALLSTDAAFLAGELHSGRLGVLTIWQPLFDAKYGFRYEGESLEVHTAESGELAWAVGSARTSFKRPGLDQEETTDGHYLHVWRRDGEAPWQLAYMASLVVHPTLGQAREPRSGLMTAWPELADRIGDRIDITWTPVEHMVAGSGEMAFTFGEYSASFGEKPEEATDETAEGGAAEAVDTEAPAEREMSGEASELDAAEKAIGGSGHYLAVWQRDDAGRWQLAGEGFTPPTIHGGS